MKLFVVIVTVLGFMALSKAEIENNDSGPGHFFASSQPSSQGQGPREKRPGHRQKSEPGGGEEYGIPGGRPSWGNVKPQPQNLDEPRTPSGGVPQRQQVFLNLDGSDNTFGGSLHLQEDDYKY